jgi:Secretion system C-terminal sorting domain
MKQFNIFLLLFLCSQGIMNAQISDKVIGDTKFWATGKLKPITMTNDELDEKVTVQLREEYNGSVWFNTGVDSSVLDNSCKRLVTSRYVGGFNQPFKLNVLDSFLYLGRLGKTNTKVYNTSTNPVTLSIQITGTYYYIGTIRSEPDSINTLSVQGGNGNFGIKKATFSGLNQIASITLYDRVNGVITPNTRNTYTYSSAGLTKVTPETWLAASSKWVACTTCENITITYDNTSRIVEQVNNAPNGDSVRYVMTYIGTTNKVKTITTQLKRAGTTVWNQESQATNTAQNPTGYPTNIDYFDGSDSLRIGFQYLADSAMTQRLISAKGVTGFVNFNRITQSFCAPCTAILPVIQAQPTPTTITYIGQAAPGIGIAGRNIASFQWQVSTNNGGSWTNINAADTTVYLVGSYGNATSGGNFITVKAPTAAQNGHQFRVIVSNGCAGSVTSGVSTLSVQTCTVATPVIQSEPDQTKIAYLGQGAVGTGIYAINYTSFQWQLSTDGGNSWQPLSPTDTTTYLIGTYPGGTNIAIKNPTSAQNGYKFRVVIYNTCNISATSTVCTISVQTCASPSSTIQSQSSSISRFEGQSAIFSVQATNVSSYEWYYYKATDTVNRFFVNPADTTFTGQNTNVLTLKYAKTSYDGYSFFCGLFNGCALPVRTNLAKLTVQTCNPVTAVIQAQPLNSLVNTGASATFSINVTTPNIFYRWEVKKTTANAVWSAIFISDTTFTGQQSPTLVVNYAKYDYNGYKYRCRAFNCAGGSVYSDSALLTVICPGGLPTVVTAPSSVMTTVGTPKRIDVTGTNITAAQWQVSDGNGGVFRDILATDTTYTIGATTSTNANITIKFPKIAQNGFAYRVILSNSCGDTKASVGTSLIVNFPSAVNELDAKVRIYPNPTNDVINIDLPITNFKVTLSDSKGSVMLKADSKNQISIKELPTGLYFLNVKTADGETTKKVVKH